MAEETNEKKGGSSFLKVLVGTIVLVALAAGATAFVIKQHPELVGLPKSQKQVQSEVDMLIAEVGKLIELPKDEKPTVATVTDASKLKDQPFFKNAKNGDKVLIYTTTRRAILYRPSEHRIIDVGAVNIRQDQQAPEGTTQTNPTSTTTSTPTPAEKPVKVQKVVPPPKQ